MNPGKKVRIAIVHDYLMQAGGAERVVEAMHQIWPDAPIYTSVYDAATLPAFQTMDVRTSVLQRWVGKPHFHKLALPFYPVAFEQFDLSGYDVVLSSTTGFAKGVITGPETCHICYCHTPARFAWRSHEYLAQGNYGRTTRRALALVLHGLRAWDYASAQRVDYFVANSANTARRIRKFYSRDSEVIQAPVDCKRFCPSGSAPENYFVIISRLVGYKRIGLAVEAFNRLKLPLWIVGSGPELSHLRSLAGPTIQFLGQRSDAEVAHLLAGCRALIFPGEEDFGITPLEAMASGRPVVAYAGGGALETVIDGQTGVFFHSPTPEALMGAVSCLTNGSFETSVLQSRAAQFDVPEFQRRLEQLVETRRRAHFHDYKGMGSVLPAVSVMERRESEPCTEPQTSDYEQGA